MNKNKLWNYFTSNEKDLGKAQCIQCKKIFSLGSNKPKLQTLSGLKNHLSKCHKDIYNLYLLSLKKDNIHESSKILTKNKNELKFFFKPL